MVVNPKQTRGRRSSTSGELVDLMQLMRRRSRYRPYSANNSNNRSTFDIFPNVRNRRYPLFPGNSGSRVRNRTNTFRRSSIYEGGLYPDLNPLFFPFNRVERHDVDTNTEIPCCSTHSFPLVQHTEQTESKAEIVEAPLKQGESPVRSDSNSEEDNNSNATTSKAAKMKSLPDATNSNLEKAVTSSILPTENTQIISSLTNINPIPGLALNRSSTTDPSSSDVSGSSLSYPEDNGLVRQQILNDDLSKNILVIEPCPNQTINLLNINNSTSYTGGICNYTSVTFVPKEQCVESSENEIKENNNKCENTSSSKNLKRSSDDVGTGSVECINVRDSNSNKSTSSENVEVKDSPEQAHADTEETSSQDVVEISSRESNVEAPASSDSLNLSSAQFAFIEVYPNRSTENNSSDSTISNEAGNGTALNTADSKAGGDGHHNDTLMQIEFSLATVMNADDEDMESNPDGEEDNEET